ncbi:hypothetical protein RugamoR1_56500 [Rugamonas sp. R1(2021)]
MRRRQRILHLALAFLVRRLQFGAQHDHGALQIAHLGQRQTQTVVVDLDDLGNFRLFQDSPTANKFTAASYHPQNRFSTVTRSWVSPLATDIRFCVPLASLYRLSVV